MAANCEVLVDIAFYVQHHFPEALLVAEQLRLNAREIQWHLDRLKLCAQLGKLKSTFPDYAERAIAIYYSMSKQLPELCRAAALPGYEGLESVL